MCLVASPRTPAVELARAVPAPVRAAPPSELHGRRRPALRSSGLRPKRKGDDGAGEAAPADGVDGASDGADEDMEERAADQPTD